MSGPVNICGFYTSRESQGNASQAYEEMSLADLEEALARVSCFVCPASVP
jgi:hypothetical protein